ncbi:MAG TPA: acetyltransferase [Bacteroidales bacterium]|nr:acetyltransferase [Bacteroidales bacterium]
MENVIIIGAGGHAAEINEYITHSEVFAQKKTIQIIGFLDDNPENYARYNFDAPLLGGVKDHVIRSDCRYIIGIADLTYRRLFVDTFKKSGATFLSFIHFNTYISKSATIGEGSVIGPNVTIGPNVQIGQYTLINSRCSIGHDTIVGNYNFISPNVCMSGFTKVGDENLFGINSATIPGICIGNRNKIGAGMILDGTVGDDTVVFYRYKEKIIAVPKRT